MTYKIICKYHDDHTPSMVVYETGWGHCYVCSAHVLVDRPGCRPIRPVKGDIVGDMEYIQNLPIELVRGLKLHVDSRGYYVVWPNSEYYIRRNWIGEPRYYYPRGIRSPLLLYQYGPGLIAIEGQINVCTLHTIVRPEHTICSPGSATEFKRHIKEYLKYDDITLILDHDAPGIAHGIEVRDILLKSGKRARLVTVHKDYNDILQEQGPEAVKLQFERDTR